MSSLDDLLPLAGANAADQAPASNQAVAMPERLWLNRLDAALLRISERLNPIVIKESRQALKSKQFTITFALVLAAGWFWSMLGLGLLGPSAYYSSNGSEMFFGYFLILAFPLLVIVPFGAFRSLSLEREDRTYELVSITTLRPRQIVSGKLAASVVQMLVYLSAISPCLAFTYLLRGIDIITIVTVVLYTALASFGLALVSLLAATLSADKYRQVGLLAGLLFGLVIAFWCGCVLAYAYIEERPNFNPGMEWIFHAVVFSFYVSYLVLIFQAAAAMLSFSTSNRSTGQRVTMLVQQGLLAGWMACAWHKSGQEVLYMLLFISLAHWYAMGVLMTGEPSRLSPRVKRSLPQSFFGRAFLTWFNPGPATGYVFTLVSFGTIAWAVCEVATLRNAGWLSFPAVHVYSYLPLRVNQFLAALAIGYLAFYLGLGKLILSWAGRYVEVGLLLRLLVHGLLLFGGTFIPWVTQLMLENMRSFNYSVFQVTNPFWTLYEVGEGRPIDLEAMLIIVVTLGLTAFLLNLPGIIREIEQVRIAKPQRIAEEDAALASASAPAEPVKTSPWD